LYVMFVNLLWLGVKIVWGGPIDDTLSVFRLRIVYGVSFIGSLYEDRIPIDAKLIAGGMCKPNSGMNSSTRFLHYLFPEPDLMF
ncbi:hypothetical protein NL529_27845, partial [Klebsiella pneumoniae]|nr:hypothetical protein [Klebsiella pneumoniae]